MAQKSFGSARAIYNGVSYPISNEVDVTHGDFYDDSTGLWFNTAKQQHNLGAEALRTPFSPEITFPFQAVEGFDIASLFSSPNVNYNVTFGGSTYSIVGGFRISDGVKIPSGTGLVEGITITGGVYRKITG